MRRVATTSVVLGLIAFLSACVVAGPREGYYDRDHHRYWHENGWHDCAEHGEFCR
jgi:hypothetical protein